MTPQHELPYAFKSKVYMKLLIILIFSTLANYAMANSQSIDDLKLELRYAVAGSEWSKMIEVADKILKLEPESADACFEKAEGLTWLKGHQEAIIFYDLAIKHGDDDRGVYFARDGVLLKLGRLGKNSD